MPDSCLKHDAGASFSGCPHGEGAGPGGHASCAEKFGGRPYTLGASAAILVVDGIPSIQQEKLGPPPRADAGFGLWVIVG